MPRRIILAIFLLLPALHAQHVGVDGTGNFYCKKGDGSACAYPSSGGGLPSGLIVLTLTACPTGFIEVASLSGQMLRGTVAANGDIGTTGGNATITPSGTVSQPSFAGNAVDPSPPFTKVIFCQAN